MIDTTVKISSLLKFMTIQELRKCALVCTSALVDYETFKQAYHHLSCRIGCLSDLKDPSNCRVEIVDLSCEVELTRLLFLCSTRLIALTAPEFICAQTIYTTYEPGWFYTESAFQIAPDVNCYQIYNPGSVQMGECYVFKGRPDLDYITLKEGIDYELMVTTVLIAQINCKCRVSL